MFDVSERSPAEKQGVQKKVVVYVASRQPDGSYKREEVALPKRSVEFIQKPGVLHRLFHALGVG